MVEIGFVRASNERNFHNSLEIG